MNRQMNASRRDPSASQIEPDTVPAPLTSSFGSRFDVPAGSGRQREGDDSSSLVRVLVLALVLAAVGAAMFLRP